MSERQYRAMPGLLSDTIAGFYFGNVHDKLYINKRKRK